MKDSAYNSRRSFLKGAGAAAASGVLAPAQTRGKTVALVVNPADPVASSGPAKWAAAELSDALTFAGITVRRYDRVQQASAADFVILAAQQTLRNVDPQAREWFTLAPSKEYGRPGTVTVVAASDPRGFVYGLLELADRVRLSPDPLAAIQVSQALVERPVNQVRSLQRLFCSDVEDKGWFNDREMWPPYLTLLASERFNRFQLAFGIGYDFLREVTDAYGLFLYPFMLDVPGYKVRAAPLPDAERDRNLETLRYISEQTVARGLEFQLGIWMHGYEWANSPNVKANYTIEGLNAENHGPYCRDALAALLKACPAISGITFRIHGESGVAEGSYPFWKTVFDGIRLSGRKVEIDMHAKGLDQGMIDVALGTGSPVRVSPKLIAEHMGMPYQQADIREQEIPKRTATGLMALSSGSRSFTRYGYADFLREDRPYSVIYRVWPGTQRLLLWADPVTAAAYSRAAGFCGSEGAELMEALSFKGRRGSGVPGGRCAYADESLKPRWDWEKYAYSLRVWGRALYNPDSDPDGWRRYLRSRFDAAGPPAGEALASASRILPIITTGHMASAGNNNYWPEVYTNHAMIPDPRHRNPYTDSPSPKVFTTVEPGDPQLFSRMCDFADELLKGERSGKYSPIEVAQWLEDLAAASGKNLKDATGRAKDSVEFRRLALDVDLEIGVGSFFASKFRAGVLFALHERTGDRAALEEALKAYRSARTIWAQIAERGSRIYVPDIAVGELPWLKGHWSDRLPAIDDDIKQMEQRLAAAKASDHPRVKAAIAEALGHPHREIPACTHQAPARFKPRQAVDLAFSMEKGAKLASARLYYRHVDQAERYQSADMALTGERYHASIPGEYTDSPYPLQYYFELRQSPEKAWIYPGFNADRTNQPYFVVRRTA